MVGLTAGVPASSQLANLPDELIIKLLLQLTTPSFLQLILSSHRFYDIAATSRDVILHHLHTVPGNKMGLEDASLENADLFLLLRQRMSKNLYGLNFTANCSEYVSKNARIDPTASCIQGFDTDYIRMSLTFLDSSTIRHYTSHCSLKERVDDVLGAGARILFTHHRKHYVSVLCSWQKPEKTDGPPVPQYLKDEDSNLKPTVRRELQRLATYDRESKIEWPQEKPPKPKRVKYRVLHFDAFSKDDPFCFVIEKHKELVPKHFTVCTRGYFAILWDREGSRKATPDAEVVKYTASKFIFYEPVPFESKVIWPKQKRPRSSRNAEEEEETAPTQFPKRIAFFKDGRRMKMWTEGGTVPYQVLSTSGNEYDRYSPTNLITYDDFSVRVDLPFSGIHETISQDNSAFSYCHLTHLALGVTTMSVNDNEDVKVMYILRSKSRQHPRSCDHTVGLQKMVHVSAGTTKVVARLWGWHELQSNLTGLETLSISKEGTRIAIAMWNKVLVYNLDPHILCQETLDELEEDQNQHTPKKKRKNKKPEKGPADDYYERVKDDLVDSNIVILRPIVLDLKGAVAHKMSWTTVKKKSTSTNTVTERPTEPELIDIDAFTANADNIQPPEIIPLTTEPSTESSLVENTIIADESIQDPVTTSMSVPLEAPQTSISTGQSETDEVTGKDDKQELPEPAVPHVDAPIIIQPPDLVASQPLPQPVLLSPPLSPPTHPQKSSSRKKEKAPESSATLELASKKEIQLSSKQIDKIGNLKSIEVEKETSADHVPQLISTSGPSASGSQIEASEPHEIPTPIALAAVPEAGSSMVVSPSEQASEEIGDSKAEAHPAEKEPVQSAPALEQPEAKQPEACPREKRRGEDELIILTDRGIQIWNLGPDCVGIRSQEELRLEESLKGKLPIRGA